jgi:hypothetical protein
MRFQLQVAEQMHPVGIPNTYQNPRILCQSQLIKTCQLHLVKGLFRYVARSLKQ